MRNIGKAGIPILGYNWRPNPLYRTGRVPGRGFLCRSRDQYGFSYGVAVAQVDDIVVHIRYAALSKVTRQQVSTYLERAVRTAVRKAHLHAAIS